MTHDQLIKEISQANAAYASGLPFITDAEYDILWQQLHAIDPTNPLLYHTAQTRSNLTGKSWHKQPIYGTNKAFNMEDLKLYLTRFGSQLLKIEPKYDGCAVVITKVNTDLGMTITLEGDGQCGSDITHLFSFIKFPSNLRHFQSVEILIPLDEWKPEYGANPRNVVAGWLARKYDKPTAMMTAISHNNGPLFHEYNYSGDLDNFGELLLGLYNEWSKIYPMDGLMIKVADEKARLIAGNNGQVNNWSIAWKPPIQVKETTVIDIEWNVSRLGRLVPTIIYESIELCGTSNNRVTGNNAQWLLDKGVAIGTTITVGKAGEIIPKIITVKNPNTETLPIKCPKCNNFLDWEGVHLVCNGDKCIAKLIVSIAYFYSHKGIKIDGIGERTIETLLEDQKIYEVLSHKPWALLDTLSYNIADRVINILGPVVYTNLFEQITKVNNTCSMAHFVAGLGLPGLAYKSALRLCQYLKSGQINIHITDKAKKSFISAATIYTEAIKEMKNFSFIALPSTAKAIYCITGTLSYSRDAMIELLNAYGYEFSSTVTRETNYLIVGQDPGKIKVDKAIKYNIPQISEEQLFAIIKNEK
jgi:DNA ligase (NAD+)